MFRVGHFRGCPEGTSCTCTTRTTTARHRRPGPEDLGPAASAYQPRHRREPSRALTDAYRLLGLGSR